MGFRTLIVYHSPSGRECPSTVTEFAKRQGLEIEYLPSIDEVMSLVNRTFPAGVVIETTGDDHSFVLCRALKSDTFSAIVPVILMAPASADGIVYNGLEAGADEVLTDAMDAREQLLRLHVTLNRADRDVGVHPTTRLAGTAQIERDIGARMQRNELFAVCYADLDHFKEFNDRYGYNEGDRVILLLSRILRDVVKAYAPNGFIGHIGGDDFIFNAPLDNMRVICEEIIEIFDELIPYQYTEEDRRAGYFLGRDRRGNILWVPLMTLSIGVVTNQVRRFTHTARVSELATEMKIFAKKLPGSIYAVDRRSDSQDIFIDPAGFSPHRVDVPIEQ
jgi:diguanylate cyclase (GGDEF)-like protein